MKEWIGGFRSVFCVSRFLARDRNYDWRQRKTQLWRRHLNFRVRVFVKSAVIDLLVFFICYYCLHRLRQYHRQISSITCEEEKKLPFYLHSFFVSSQLNNSIFWIYQPLISVTRVKYDLVRGCKQFKQKNALPHLYVSLCPPSQRHLVNKLSTQSQMRQISCNCEILFFIQFLVLPINLIYPTASRPMTTSLFCLQGSVSRMFR